MVIFGSLRIAFLCETVTCVCCKGNRLQIMLLVSKQVSSQSSNLKICLKERVLECDVSVLVWNVLWLIWIS